MPYNPSVPPQTNVIRAVLEWVVRELQSVGLEFENPRTTHQLKVAHVVPDRPRQGMLAYADGSDWDPGSGEGLYVYKSGGWTKAA